MSEKKYLYKNMVQDHVLLRTYWFDSNNQAQTLSYKKASSALEASKHYQRSRNYFANINFCV